MTQKDDYVDGYMPRRYDGIPLFYSYPEHKDDFPFRPKLSKEFAAYAYDPKQCPEMHNSAPWLSEYQIASVLPLVETYALLSKQCGSMLKMAKEQREDCPLLKPDIMCDLLTELLENNNRAILKSRWGKNYPRIMEEYRFLFYRVKCRRRIMALYYGDQPKDPKSASAPLVFDAGDGADQKQDLRSNADTLEALKRLSEVILKASLPA